MKPLVIEQPRAYQVIQRERFDPAYAHAHGDAAALGGAAFQMKMQSAPPADSKLEYRVLPLDDAFGIGTDWRALVLGSDPRGALAEAPAGGWYRLEIRAIANGGVCASGSMEPFGIGELFLIAGQSYADNCNDEMLRVAEPLGRVVAFDPASGSWRIAHDPQPTPSPYRDGSIWPAVGDALVSLLRVPVGFVNVAFGGTASAQWLPGQTNFLNLVQAGKSAGSFRYVLWQQGESDVINGISTEQYRRNLVTIRDACANEWNSDSRWLLAKSTLHPTVYNNPTGEQTIRDAIDRLWTTSGFAPGPDTDVLGGDLRGDIHSKRHFSPKGQRMAALMWCGSIWNQLNRF